MFIRVLDIFLGLYIYIYIYTIAFELAIITMKLQASKVNVMQYVRGACS